MAEPARARVLLALADGRALPASQLASEAGVAPSTLSEHLAKLVAAGLLTVEPQGRFRYYRVAGPLVVGAIEALAQLSPVTPVRSLREGTRAQALRRARLCYDHLAGRLGVAVMGALLDSDVLEGGDGEHHPVTAPADRLSAPGRVVDYRLTPAGVTRLTSFGIDVAGLADARRPLVRYCLDWTEQRHHLAGALGAALASRMFDLGWLRRGPVRRAVLVTEAGRAGIGVTFGADLPDGSA